MKNKPNFFLITGVSQTGGMGGGVPPLGNFSHVIPFFSPVAFLRERAASIRRGCSKAAGGDEM